MKEIKLSDLSTWNDWDIGCVLNRYAEAIKKVNSYAEEDALKKKFVKLVKLQVINDGHVMFAEDFAEEVKNGGFTSYDGFGYYMNENDEEHNFVDFKPENILKNAKDYPYVCWYNK